MFVPQQILSLAAVIKHKHLQLFMWYKFFQTLILYSQEIGYELMIPMLEFFSIVLCHEIETVLHYVCVHSIKVDLKVTGHI